MPIIKSAKKAARQSVKRRENNQQIKKTIRAAVKEFKSKPTAESFKKAQSEYDKAVKKGLLKKNTASRRKAKLAIFAKAAGVKNTATAKKAAAPKAAKPAEKKAPATKTAAAKKPAAKKTTTAAKKPAAKKAPAKKAAEK